MAITRDENGKLVVRRRPGRRKPEEPMHRVAPSNVSEEPAGTQEKAAPVDGDGSVGATGRRAVRNGNADSSSPVRADDRGVLQDWMCGAKLRGEKAGLLCRNPKMRGAKRCRMHGSASLVAREKARERIIMASDVAAKKLIEFMKDPNAPYSVKLAAAKDLLDRSDLAGKSTVEVEMPKFEQLLNRVVNRRPGYTEPDPRVIEGEVVEPDRPALPPAGDDIALPEFDPTREARTSPAAAKRPPEPHVNSDDTPPAYIRRKTPGYQSTGGERRTPTEMRNG